MHQSDTQAPSPHQNIRTPRDVLDAVERRFGRITIDLAAENREASVCDLFIDEAQDSLSDATVWPTAGVLWLNPPFKKIDPWASKCHQWVKTAVPGSKLLFLVLESIDSNWWSDHVRGVARPLTLRPRVKFVGHEQGFPKPIAICVYDPSWPTGGPEELWDYKT